MAPGKEKLLHPTSFLGGLGKPWFGHMPCRARKPCSLLLCSLPGRRVCLMHFIILMLCSGLQDSYLVICSHFYQVLQNVCDCLTGFQFWSESFTDSSLSLPGCSSIFFFFFMLSFIFLRWGFWPPAGGHLLGLLFSFCCT